MVKNPGKNLSCTEYLTPSTQVYPHARRSGTRYARMKRSAIMVFNRKEIALVTHSRISYDQSLLWLDTPPFHSFIYQVN